MRTIGIGLEFEDGNKFFVGIWFLKKIDTMRDKVVGMIMNEFPIGDSIDLGTPADRFEQR